MLDVEELFERLDLQSYTTCNSLEISVVLNNKIILFKVKDVSFTEVEGLSVGILTLGNANVKYIKQILNKSDEDSLAEIEPSILIKSTIGDETIFKVGKKAILTKVGSDSLKVKDFAFISEVGFVSDMFTPWLPMHVSDLTWSCNDTVVGDIPKIYFRWSSFLDGEIKGSLMLDSYYYGLFLCAGTLTIRYPADIGVIVLKDVEIFDLETNRAVLTKYELDFGELYGFRCHEYYVEECYEG